MAVLDFFAFALTLRSSNRLPILAWKKIWKKSIQWFSIVVKLPSKKVKKKNNEWKRIALNRKFFTCKHKSHYEILQVNALPDLTLSSLSINWMENTNIYRFKDTFLINVKTIYFPFETLSLKEGNRRGKLNRFNKEIVYKSNRKANNEFIFFNYIHHTSLVFTVYITHLKWNYINFGFAARSPSFAVDDAVCLCQWVRLLYARGWYETNSPEV